MNKCLIKVYFEYYCGVYSGDEKERNTCGINIWQLAISLYNKKSSSM